MRQGFRYKLLALALLPILVGLSGTFLIVTNLAKSEVKANAHAELKVGTNVVGQYLASRANDLTTKVEILASDYAIKEVLAYGDEASLGSALKNHGNRVGAKFAMFIYADGSAPVFTDVEFGQRFGDSVTELIDENLDSQKLSALILNDGVYQIFGAPVNAPTVIGFLILGFEANDVIVEGVKTLAGLDTALVQVDGGEISILSTTVEKNTQDGWVSPNAPTQQTFTTQTSVGEFISLNTEFHSGDSRVLIAMRRSVDEAMQPYREARNTMIFFSLIVLAIVAGIALWIARSMAKPLHLLTLAAAQMSRGEYSSSIEVTSKDEFGILASAFQAMQIDIAEREMEMQHQAYHDPLTDLPNRAHLARSVRKILDQQTPRLTLICIRFSNMPKVVSSIGQSSGDALLIQAINKIQSQLKEDALLFHTSTEEFFVLAENASEKNTEQSVSEIVRLLLNGVATEHHNVLISANCGISEFPKHGDNAEHLIRAARIAATDALDQNVSVAHYQISREEQYERQIRIINDLPSAIADSDLHLVYQPKISIETGELYGAEALVRWEHKELGFLPPDEFIPAAEQAGTIIPLTKFVLQRSLVALSKWRREHPDLTLGINLSTRDLLEADLPKFVQNQLDYNGLPSDAVTLEITETSILENVERSLKTLNRLRDIGVRISIDDFGTGHSSLSQLHTLPVDELKIDKSFVTNLETDPASEILVQSTIELAHRFGLLVVAEGVEDEYSLRRLAELNCEIAQGYFISKPIAQSTFTKWARDYVPQVYREQRNYATRSFHPKNAGVPRPLHGAPVVQRAKPAQRK